MLRIGGVSHRYEWREAAWSGQVCTVNASDDGRNTVERQTGSRGPSRPTTALGQPGQSLHVLIHRVAVGLGELLERIGVGQHVALFQPPNLTVAQPRDVSPP